MICISFGKVRPELPIMNFMIPKGDLSTGNSVVFYSYFLYHCQKTKLLIEIRKYRKRPKILTKKYKKSVNILNCSSFDQLLIKRRNRNFRFHILIQNYES